MKEVGEIKVRNRDPMPDISLPSTRGHPMSPAEFRGKKNVILAFLPGNESIPELAGDAEEAIALRDIMPNLREMGATVLGVSRQTTEEQRAFHSEHALNFPLLSDADGRLAAALGVPELHVKKTVYPKRVTFVIDSHGVIRRILPDVKPETHKDEVLSALFELRMRK